MKTCGGTHRVKLLCMHHQQETSSTALKRLVKFSHSKPLNSTKFLVRFEELLDHKCQTLARARAKPYQIAIRAGLQVLYS